MPTLAHFETLIPKSDRRRSIRRSLKLGSGEGDYEVTVHDLSRTGALLETSAPMLVGATFEFELPHAGRVDATIIWNSGEYYGCQFDLPIPPSVLSAAMLKSVPGAQDGSANVDPLAELRELSAEVERVALKMESALKRLTKRSE